MTRRKQVNASQRQKPRKPSPAKPLSNKAALKDLLNWYAPQVGLFAKGEFHGNIKWSPEQIAVEALVWSWQDTKNVTDAFDQTLEICGDLGLKDTAKTDTAFMNALERYHDVLGSRLRERFQRLAEEIGGEHWRTNGWVLIGFDGSRATAPRTVSNERAYCAPNYGHGKRAKYGKKKSKGLRRQRNQNHKPQPQTATTSPSGVDHHDVAHEAAVALDLAHRAVEFQRTRARRGNAGNRRIPRRNVVLR